MPLRMSGHALSQAIHVPATWVDDIVNGKRGVTADAALRVARYFGNSPEFWLNLQVAHNGSHRNARIDGRVREHAGRISGAARMVANGKRRNVLKVFISWSGPLSKCIATELRDWLSLVLRGLKILMSSEDIGLGYAMVRLRGRRTRKHPISG